MDPSTFDQTLATAAAHQRAGDRAAAVRAWDALRTAGARNPDRLARLAVALLDAGQPRMAVETLRAAALLRRSPGILRLLGQALLECRQFAEAEAELRSALDLAPQSADILSMLAEVALARGLPSDAAALCQRALAIAPRHSLALANLASLHAGARRCGEALALLDRLPRSRPEHAANSNNRGVALMACGRTAEAIAACRHAIALQPRCFPAWSNLLFLLHYSDAVSPEEILAEHARWAALFVPSHPPPPRPCASDPDPQRPLRVAYLSPDFRSHAVTLFLEPVLAHHDPHAVHVTCYHDSPAGDAVTARLKAHAAVWRDVYGLGHEPLANLIRADRIDILIDLAGHAQNNRLVVFALKPAPVQMTYIAYASTTGLPAMDYRISDPVLDPPGTTETLHTETLLRLPEVYWCYRPPDEAPPVADLPAAAAGHITFGSANRLAKATPTILAAWSRVLAAVPGSRFLLVQREFREALARERLAQLLAGAGIAAERVTTHVPDGLADYLASLGRIDIALDTYPYSGGSTTCNLLWMGVPVVTLAGRHPISRMSATTLHAAGLPELVAATPDEFVSCAAQLAGHPARLAELRRGLRERMLRSPLMQHQRLTRHLEDAYRMAWRTCCAAPR